MPALTALLCAGSPSLAEDLGGALESRLLELRDTALASGHAYETLRSLTTEVGPRFAGSPGDRAAVEWAVRTMETLGLQNLRTEPVQVPRWVRGEESGEILSPWPQPMHLTALVGSVGTPEGGLEAEVVRVTSLEDLAGRPPTQIEGKIVFIDQRMVRTQDGSSYGQTGVIRRSGPARAAEMGAAGVLIRSLGTGTHRFAHTGATRYEEGIPQIPAAALAVPDADILSTQVDSGKPVRFRLELGAKRFEDVKSANVIGEIIGRDRPEEIVLLGAHLDSWDKGTGATYYFDYHHTDDDTLDKVDPDALAQNVAAYSVVAYWAAEREGLLGRPAIQKAAPSP